ncbi:MAG: Recombinase [Microgenomates group bacterium GW2011_GWC1_37_8]|nr:MAG: Recombinase [Microgenomates group bacterium GW2011_GWC1_37_8]
MKYIGYCRKSTDESDRQILSIESQIAELKEFADRQNVEILDFVTESRTAKMPGRPLFANVLKRIESGEAQGIISWHPDRLARNSIDGGKIIYLLDTGKLIELKFPSFWFENSPQGKFVLNIAFGQSKYYVDNLSENVKRGQRQQLRKGVLPARSPKGYLYNDLEAKHDIDPIKSKILKKAFEKYADGASQTEVAKFLFVQGITKRKGGVLSLTTVERVLTDIFYIGLFKYNGEVYQGTHKTFISKDLFDKVQKQLSLNVRKTFQKKNFPFRGLMKCGECGASITSEEHVNHYKNGNSQSFIYYRCTKKLKPCTQKFIRQEEVDKELRKLVLDVAIPEAWIPTWLKLIENQEVKDRLNQEINSSLLEKESESVDQKLNLLLDGFLDNTLDTETYKAKKNELFEKKLKIQEKTVQIRTNGGVWLEPMRELIEVSKNCGKIALAKNNSDELATIGKNIGSNYSLTDRHLTAVYKKGFDTAFSELNRFRASRAPEAHSDCERDRGVEPLFPPWEGDVGPLN